MNCSVLNGVTRFGFDDGETYISPTKKLIWNAGDSTTFLAVLQSRELQAQLDQARNEIRTDINRALQTFVDCLQAASACIIKKIKSGGCRKSAKCFNKECYDCRNLHRRNFANIDEHKDLLTDRCVLRQEKNIVHCFY